ncbi:hypothetical protein GCM10009851_31960 [Herbiconiux moechotypicola]|uniref:DUF1508 domain-containing protein n=1 Tax=Herbiconiux moechotypicola TaxID=637393 RepID=A0ABP5QTQ2_9MICO
MLRLRDRVGELEIVPVQGSRPGTRGWYLTHRGVIVATCGRWYGAAASSAEAAAAALDALATAEVLTASRDVTAPGRRAAPDPRPALAW